MKTIMPKPGKIKIDGIIYNYVFCIVDKQSIRVVVEINNYGIFSVVLNRTMENVVFTSNDLKIIIKTILLLGGIPNDFELPNWINNKRKLAPVIDIFKYRKTN